MILELQGSGKVGHRGAFSLLSFSSPFLYPKTKKKACHDGRPSHITRSLWNFLPHRGVMDVSRDGAAVRSAMDAPPQRRKVTWAQEPEGHANCGRLPLSSCPRH